MNESNQLLTWHDYHGHLKEMMKDMLHDNFADITLISHDKKMVKAHKNILSAFSATFEEILSEEQQSTAMIYLRGVNYSELVSIMQFIYLGEVSISLESLNEFIEVAKSLELKQFEETLQKSLKDDMIKNNKQIHNDDNIFVPEEQEEEDLTETVKLKSYIKTGGAYMCIECCKTLSEVTSIRRHIRKKHPQLASRCNWRQYYEKVDGKFRCCKCDVIYSESSSVIQHVKVTHLGLRLKCEFCPYEARRQRTIEYHRLAVHEGVVFDCDKCEYTTAWKPNMAQHVKVKHS